MEVAKKARSVQRASFTKCLNSFKEKISDGEVNQTERVIAFQLLESKLMQLEEANTKYIQLLIASAAEEKDIEADIESQENYKLEFLRAWQLMNPEVDNREVIAENVNVVRNENKPFKRPTLEIPKFGGGVGNWLQFWSHFKKIYDDKSIADEDKLAYLKQITEKGSRAEAVLQGYPTTAENYKKAFDSLKKRFGRDELLVEYYTRELPSLVLQNATNKGKRSSVSEVYDKVSAHIRALETLGVTTNNCAIMLYPLVESSLPEEILRTWQRSSLSNESAEGEEGTDHLTRLLQFLEAEVENEEHINMAVHGFTPRLNETTERKEGARGEGKTKTDIGRNVASASALLSAESKRKHCVFCNENHENAACEKAGNMSFESRKNTLKENGCCFRCLKRGHRSRDCKVKITCNSCGNRHATLICNGMSNKRNSETNKIEMSTEKKLNEHNLASFCNVPDVYLQTLRVVLYSNNRERVVRALINSGSQRSYIKSDIVNYLGYEPVGNIEIAHSLFGGVSMKSQPHDIYLVHMKNIDSNYACNFQAVNKEIICADIPSVKKAEWFNELNENNIVLSDADPNAKVFDDKIELLLGGDVAGKLMTGKKHDLSNGLVLMQTTLGWTVMGKTPPTERTDFATKTFMNFVVGAKLSDLWELDVFGIRDPIENTNRFLEKKNVKEFFLETATRTENGRYSVDLPWIKNHEPISQNFELAKKRLDKTITKLNNEGLYDEYNMIFREWIEEDIIEVVPETELNLFSHYLPHRHVVKTGSTTKLRPVFDASASERGFPSLNECLEKGPNLIELVPSSLLRFRENEIAIIADIRKAFLQIEINKKDRDFLRFLWIFDGKLIVLRHKRVVFGLTCSPFLLEAVIELHMNNALKEIRWSRDVVKKLMKSFYVDNCTTSVKSLRELNSFMSQATEIMATGGFDLRGWEYSRDRSENPVTLVLGISFNKLRDTLLINPTVLNDQSLEIITKRVILSAAHKIFDLIGFTSPVMLLPKLLLRQLHKQKISWDEPIDEKLKLEFLQWYSQLGYLKEIEIDRAFGTGNFSIHTFCDASQRAYATVSFLRVEKENDVELKFLAAKSRVAPENTSIPSLELLAASIASRQTNEIIIALNYEKIPVYYWSDSSTALAWINRDLQWGIFVWNRVREIRQLTATGTWKYVPGEMNPADLPSRGCQARQLLDSRWWEGPKWLREDPKRWPNAVEATDESLVNAEVKRTKHISLLNLKDDQKDNMIEKFSSYEKLIRFLAIMLKFKNFKLKTEYNGNRLTCEEIKRTEIRFLKYLQSEMFCEKDERLTNLTIFIDNDGLIRLKTKIVERDDHFTFLWPIVLDRKNKAVALLIRDAHERNCHAGVQTVMCYLRERFWILSMRRAVRSVISKCVVCKRFNVQKMTEEVAPLPLNRVRDALVFEILGVDFAGPLFLRGEKKAWISLYTCAVYRAVHLELVSSMSTNAFLDSLRRFISRRGRPEIIYSDNGKNFVGAENAFALLNGDVIAKYSATKRIDWRFNPPSAPWWGGWWERLIGMLKVILRKILGRAYLDYEAMCTILCDCELTLNSRPLTYVSDDPKDLKALTPSMFLCDIRINETPDIDIINKLDLNSSFKRRQEVTEHLRNRFRKEYLSQLILKGNNKELRKIGIGDVVIVGDDQHKRIDWPLARIEKLIEGRDGKVRVVELKTKDGKLVRPIQRIYPLEICNQTEETIILREKLEEKLLNAKGDNDYTRTISKKVCNDSETKTQSGRLVKKPKPYM